MSSALQMYGLALTATLDDDGLGRGGADDIRIHFDDGSRLPLPMQRYLGPADRDDLWLLSGVAGPVLDIGCGPGRHLRALTEQGVRALGVDLSPIAVGLARSGGAHAIVGDVFGELAGVGTWRTALLLDGNIGIGGSPVRLLRRVRSLLCRDGQALVELEPPGAFSRASRAKLEHEDRTSEWFPWARVSASEIDQLAADAELTVERVWSRSGRWFAWLQVDATS